MGAVGLIVTFLFFWAWFMPESFGRWLGEINMARKSEEKNFGWDGDD